MNATFWIQFVDPLSSTSLDCRRASLMKGIVLHFAGIF